MKRKLIYIMIPMLFITGKVKALSATPNITCSSDTITTSSNVTCDLGVNVSSGSINAFDGTIELSSNLELVSINVDSSKWQGTAENNRIGVYTSDGYSNNIKIATITLKLNDSTSNIATINVKEIKMTDESYSSINYSGTTSKSLSVNTSTGETTNNTSETNTNKSTKTISNKGEEDSKSPSTTSTTTNEVQKNPDTGVFAPIITLSILGIITILILLYTKKKTLFKKI